MFQCFKMLLCQECGYTTTHSRDLNVHSRNHADDMIECQNCDYTTDDSSNLKSHSRKHTGQ